MAQWLKPPPVTPVFLLGPIQLPAGVSGKTAADDPSTSQDGVPGARLWPGPDLAAKGHLWSEPADGQSLCVTVPFKQIFF